MAKRCTRCGNFLMDDERFCTKCGENVSNVMPEPGLSGPDNSFGRNDGYVSPTAPPPPAGGSYGGQNPQYPPYPPYAQSYNSVNKDEMSLGKWVATIVVTTFFGIISLIFLFVWGFGDGPECRKRYCKAMLITMLIGLGVGIIFMIVFFSIMGGIVNNAFADYLNRAKNYSYSYDFGQLAATALSAFFG